MEFTDFFDFFSSYCFNALDLVLIKNTNENDVKTLINTLKTFIKLPKHGDKMSTKCTYHTLKLKSLLIPKRRKDTKQNKLNKLDTTHKTQTT